MATIPETREPQTVSQLYRALDQALARPQAKSRQQELFRAHRGQPQAQQSVPRTVLPKVLRAILAAYIERFSFAQFAWRYPDSPTWQWFVSGRREATAWIAEAQMEETAAMLLEDDRLAAPITSLLHYLREEPQIKTALNRYPSLATPSVVPFYDYLRDQVTGWRDPPAPKSTNALPVGGTSATSTLDHRSSGTPEAREKLHSRPRPPLLQRIELIGSVPRGGIAKLTLQSGQRFEVQLSRLMWTVFKELVSTARDGEHPELACLTPDELITRLKVGLRHSNRDYFGSRNSVAKLVLKIRNRLDQIMGRGARHVLLTSNLGYSVNPQALAENVELVVREKTELVAPRTRDPYSVP